jgi:hypothetical protein
MNASRPVGKPVDAPEVAALRKRLRGEPLTDAEASTLSAKYRKPEGHTTPHEEVMRELGERERRGG